MINWQFILAILSALILFLYGIQHFSREMQKIAGEKFQKVLTKLTKNRIGGATLGALITSLVQSSTATTVITVGLVDAGIISFAQSLGILIGANVGTTLTGQLIAFKLTSFAPFFIIFGFLLSLFESKYKFLGKPIFYFGLVFFSLNLFAEALIPYQSDPRILEIFSKSSNVFLAIFFGFIFTVLFQSSSVTTGVVVLLASTGFISLLQGIPLLLGANIGTTTTSLIVSSKMGLYARRSAMAHFLFNLLGVLILLPFLLPFANLVIILGGETSQQVANAHTIFNVLLAILFLIFINQFRKVVEIAVPGKEKEFVLKTKYLNDKIPKEISEFFVLLKKEIGYLLEITGLIFEMSVKNINNASKVDIRKIIRLENLNDFLDENIEANLLKISKKELSYKEAKKITLLVRISNSLEQLGDIGYDLGMFRNKIDENKIVFSKESRESVQKIYELFEENMTALILTFPIIDDKNNKRMISNENKLIKVINKKYQEHLISLKDGKIGSDSSFVESIAMMESALNKLKEIRKLIIEYSKI